MTIDVDVEPAVEANPANSASKSSNSTYVYHIAYLVIVQAGSSLVHNNSKLTYHVSNAGINDATHSGHDDAAHSSFVEASAGTF